MTTVTLRPNELQEQLFRRFRKKVAKSGVLSTQFAVNAGLFLKVNCDE